MRSTVGTSIRRFARTAATVTGIAFVLAMIAVAVRSLQLFTVREVKYTCPHCGEDVVVEAEDAAAAAAAAGKTVSEDDLMALSYPDAPQMVTQVPGPKVLDAMEKSKRYESVTRGAGLFPFVIDRGKGATVKDVDGNLFIDMAAGVGVSSVGRGHPKVLEAIRRQADVIMHTIDATNPKRIDLAEMVSTVMPEGLRGNCHTAVYQAGSDATETAIKWARAYTGRSQIVAFHGAYHGVWCGAGALTTGSNYRDGFGPMISGAIHLPYAYCYRCPFGKTYPDCDIQCGKFVDYVLNTPYTAANDVAAVIVEPEQGEGGYVNAPPEFLQMIKAACEKNGCLYIDDEVQAGAGRTGKMWAIEYAGVEPDILTWGKGMGGDMAMAGLSYRPEIEEKLREGSQPSTFAGNAVSCEVAMTNISLLTDPELNLVGRANVLGEELRDYIRAADVPCIGEVRGYGLMIGIELVTDRESRTPLPEDKVIPAVMGMLNRGIALFPCGRYNNVFRLMPPLVLPREYAYKAVDTMIDVLGNV
jgi:4-aminobutyrate aminotransferase